MWAFGINSLSSFRSNSLWKQPVERFMTEGISWEDLLWKFRVGADADKVTILILSKDSAYKGVFNMNKSIFCEGQQNCSKLQLYLVWQYSQESPPTGMFTRLQWKRDLTFIHPTSIIFWVCPYHVSGPVLGSRPGILNNIDKVCSFGDVVDE